MMEKLPPNLTIAEVFGNEKKKVVPESFKKSLSYSEQINYLYSLIQEIPDDFEERLKTLESEISDKQDALTFDTTPTSGSSNPVTSNGIYEAIQSGGGSVTLDDTVTSTSSNGVKSSGIYDFVTGLTDDLSTSIGSIAGDVSTLSAEVSTNAGDIAALETDKQDALTFDTTPTENSTNPVTSGGVYDAIQAGGGSVIIDQTVTEGSVNAVAGGAVYDYVAGIADGKQDALTFDDTPTSGSSNPVTSNGIYSSLNYKLNTDDVISTVNQYVTNPVSSSGIYSFVHNITDNKQDALTFDSTPTENSTNPVTSGGVYDAIQAGGGSVIIDQTVTEGSVNAVAGGAVYDYVAEIADGKQDVLTFDDTPTSGSNNPVTSNGIYEAIQSGGGSITLDDAVTSTSSNGVKSSGIYDFVTGLTDDLSTSIGSIAGDVSTLSAEVSTNAGDIATLESDKQDTLTFDSTPTENSTNPVTSGGVYDAIQAGGGSVIIDQTVTEGSVNAVAGGAVYDYVAEIADGKQDALTLYTSTNTIYSSTTNVNAANVFYAYTSNNKSWNTLGTSLGTSFCTGCEIEIGGVTYTFGANNSYCRAFGDKFRFCFINTTTLPDGLTYADIGNPIIRGLYSLYPVNLINGYIASSTSMYTGNHSGLCYKGIAGAGTSASSNGPIDVYFENLHNGTDEETSLPTTLFLVFHGMYR